MLSKVDAYALKEGRRYGPGYRSSPPPKVGEDTQTLRVASFPIADANRQLASKPEALFSPETANSPGKQEPKVLLKYP